MLIPLLRRNPSEDSKRSGAVRYSNQKDSEGERKMNPTLKGGPWGWCMSCSTESNSPVRLKISIRRDRWECSKCHKPVRVLKCSKCEFEGGDATQLPMKDKKDWGFRIIIRDGHKRICPACGDVSEYVIGGI